MRSIPLLGQARNPTPFPTHIINNQNNDTRNARQHDRYSKPNLSVKSINSSCEEGMGGELLNRGENDEWKGVGGGREGDGHVGFVKRNVDVVDVLTGVLEGYQEDRR